MTGRYTDLTLVGTDGMCLRSPGPGRTHQGFWSTVWAWAPITTSKSNQKIRATSCQDALWGPLLLQRYFIYIFLVLFSQWAAEKMKSLLGTKMWQFANVTPQHFLLFMLEIIYSQQTVRMCYSGKCHSQGLQWNPILQWSGERVMSKEYKETDDIACRDSVMATYAISPVISQPESVPAGGHFSLQDHLLPCHLPPGERTMVCEWVHFLSHHGRDVWHSLHLYLSQCFMVDSRRRLTLCQLCQQPVLRSLSAITC